MRSPLAYPLTRAVDADAGGAADLQTDIMRFMAILALCLVAIFALVQSLPLAPQPTDVTKPAPERAIKPTPKAGEVSVSKEPQTEKPVILPAAPATPVESTRVTRPAWTPKFTPQQLRPASEATASETGPVGFSLRFESDLALTRLVAAGGVGLYAITDARARRMTVSNGRISFWDASIPNAFHEMEATTVPSAVVDALSRSGADAADLKWGVTLPAGMKNDLETLMLENVGGTLTIGEDAVLRLEPQP